MSKKTRLSTRMFVCYVTMETIWKNTGDGRTILRWKQVPMWWRRSLYLSHRDRSHRMINSLPDCELWFQIFLSRYMCELGIALKESIIDISRASFFCLHSGLPYWQRDGAICSFWSGCTASSAKHLTCEIAKFPLIPSWGKKKKIDLLLTQDSASSFVYSFLSRPRAPTPKSRDNAKDNFHNSFRYLISSSSIQTCCAILPTSFGLKGPHLRRWLVT